MHGDMQFPYPTPNAMRESVKLLHYLPSDYSLEAERIIP
jgi:hypothetical protein